MGNKYEHSFLLVTEVVVGSKAEDPGVDKALLESGDLATWSRRTTIAVHHVATKRIDPPMDMEPIDAPVEKAPIGSLVKRKRRWMGWDMRSALRGFASRLRPFKMDVVEDMERMANEIDDDDPMVWREAVEQALGEKENKEHTPDWAFSKIKRLKEDR